MGRRLLLKTFSGPHFGAEAVLMDGEYTLGRGPQCDLVFEDHAVAEEHLKLKVEGERVHAHPLGDARMLIGGKPTDGCTLPPCEYFTIGTTHLAVGFAGEQWKLKPLPEIKLGDDTAPMPREPEAPAAVATPTPKKPRRKRFLYAVSLLAVLGLGTWGAWVALTPTIHAAISGPDGKGAALDAIIAKFGVGETVKSEKTERGWIVQGHLKDRESVKTLSTEFRNLLPASAIRLWDSETLAAASGEVLAAFRVAVAAAPGKPGEVVFQGRVPNAAQWARVRERIRHDVPALVTLSDQVLTGTGRYLKDHLGREIDVSKTPAPKVGSAGDTYVLAVPFPPLSAAPKEEAKSDSPVATNDREKKSATQEQNGKSNVTEQISASTKAPAASANQESTAPVKYVAATPVANAAGTQTSTSPAGDKPIPPPVLAYQSVSVGAWSCLRLADGTRVSVGGRIGGGYEVTSISDEAIEARKGETRIVYRLREGT